MRRAERVRVWASRGRTPARDVDYKVLQAFGRVYPVAVDPTDEDATRCEAIADRLAELDALRDAAFGEDGEDGDVDETVDIDALETEYEALNAEYESRTTGWSADDLGRAGVLAYWDRGEIATAVGLVRPEDRTDRTPEAPGAGSSDADGTGRIASADGRKRDDGDDAESDALVLCELAEGRPQDRAGRA